MSFGRGGKGNMVTTIKPVSHLFKQAVGTVYMSLLGAPAWVAIGKVINLCLAGSHINIALDGHVDMASMTALLNTIKNVRSEPDVVSDWAWRQIDDAALSFFWRSGNPRYNGKREVSVYINYSSNVASFSWDTGTGEESELITSDLFVHVPADAVVP